ncbi:MAG: M48 family metallopeptidase [Acidobacteriia bacterium]|nr:M48 family metallopeptidase [Terriglobia bacterium]
MLFGFGLFALSWVVLDVTTAFVPVLLGTVGLIVYVLYQQGALKGSSVAVSPRNFPDIESLAQEAASRLGIGKPNLFIKQSRELNAYAMGFVGSACVVVHSEIVSATEHAPRELQFIIGHEFTHIKCSHVLWQTIAAKNPLLGSVPILNFVLPLFFSWWSRQAELTADRGGLIACGDLAASQKALARLVIGAELFDRLNVEEFVKQAYDGDVATKANELFSSHPLLAKRIVALAEFSRSPLVARAPQMKARAQEA